MIPGRINKPEASGPATTQEELFLYSDHLTPGGSGKDGEGCWDGW